MTAPALCPWFVVNPRIKRQKSAPRAGCWSPPALMEISHLALSVGVVDDSVPRSDLNCDVHLWQETKVDVSTAEERKRGVEVTTEGGTRRDDNPRKLIAGNRS